VILDHEFAGSNVVSGIGVAKQSTVTPRRQEQKNSQEDYVRDRREKIALPTIHGLPRFR
jgi:hypothetical protein